MSTPDDDFDIDAFDAAFAKEFGDPLASEPLPAAGSDPQNAEADPAGEAGADAADEPAQSSERSIIAIVLTPVADARILARLMGLVKLDWPVFATRTGASAAAVLEVDELTALSGSVPTEAAKVAAVLSQTSEYGVVLLTSQVGQSDEGATGQIQAIRYVAGEEVERLSPGVVLAGADSTVDSVVFGMVAPAAVAGALSPIDVANSPEENTASERPRKRRWGRKPRSQSPEDFDEPTA